MRFEPVHAEEKTPCHYQRFLQPTVDDALIEPHCVGLLTEALADVVSI